MAAQKELYDAIVIGAGIQGCFTAYHLAKHSRRVLLLEQVLCPFCTSDLRECPFLLPQESFLESAGCGLKTKGPDYHNFCAICSLAAWVFHDNAKKVPPSLRPTLVFYAHFLLLMPSSSCS